MKSVNIILLFFFFQNLFSQDFNFDELRVKNQNVIIEEVSAVGIDSNSNILLFHRGNNSLFKVDPFGNVIRFYNDDIFSNSHGLKIDRYDNIWTTDVNTHMVTKLNKYGEVLMVLGKKNTPGIWLINDDNSEFLDKESMPLFDKPADIAFDSKDNIYVADGYGNNRVVKFNKNGKYLLEWGNKGSANGQFNLPHGITIDNNDNVYVADRENARIQVFDSNGNFIHLWDKIGYPYGIKYYNGYVYMTDARNEKVKKIDLSGDILWEIGSPGKGLGEFGWAHGIDISKDGIIYISEILNWRVQILKVSNENN